MECSSSPTLLAKELATQGRDMPVPGGVIVFMIMNRLSEIPIDKFWIMDSMELLSYSGYVQDCLLVNSMFPQISRC